MRKVVTVKVLSLAAVALLGPAALAHKAKDADHSHCVLKGAGVKGKGANDAERKPACLKVEGAVWEEAQAVKIEEPQK